MCRQTDGQKSTFSIGRQTDKQTDRNTDKHTQIDRQIAANIYRQMI